LEKQTKALPCDECERIGRLAAIYSGGTGTHRVSKHYICHCYNFARLRQ